MKKKTVVLLVLAAMLLLGSAVGSTRAALIYYSDNYVVGINTSKIGVSLVENGKERDKLLTEMLPEGETFKYQRMRIILKTSPHTSNNQII